VIPAAGLLRMAGLLWLLFAVGCQTTSLEANLEVPIHGSWRLNQDARAELVWRQYLERASSRTALHGSARVTLEGTDFKLNRPQRILVERPARLRFEIIGLFDQVLAMLAVDGSTFGFYDIETAEVSRGHVTPSLLWDLARIDLGVPALVDFLLAAPTPSPGLARIAFWLESDDQIAFAFAKPDQELAAGCGASSDRRFFDSECFLAVEALKNVGEIFTFDSAGHLNELRSLDSEGRLRFHVSFANYQSMPGDAFGSEFPYRITIRSPAIGSEAHFVWKRVLFAETLADRFFEIRLGQGSTPGD
jgi:hypothetical protein